MSNARIRRRVPALIATVTATLVLANPVGTSAAPSSQERCHSCVEVVGSPDGISAPATIRSGATTFRVTTSDEAGIRLGLFRLNKDVRLDPFLEHLRTALTGEGDEQLEAGRSVVREAVMLGGQQTTAGRPATFSLHLRPGRYHLVDYEDIEEGDTNQDPATHQLTVRHVPRPRHGGFPMPDSAITMIDAADGPRYLAPRVLSPDATILVSNLTDQVEEAVFMPVKPGTTERDVQEFYEALDSGQPAESPFAGLPHGMPVTSAHRGQIVRPNLPRGEYALVSWVIDLDDGGMRGADGMHQLVTVR